MGSVASGIGSKWDRAVSWIGSQTALSVADTFEWRKELPGMQTTVVKVSSVPSACVAAISAYSSQCSGRLMARSDAPHLGWAIR